MATKLMDFSGSSAGKESACNVGNLSLIPGTGNSMDCIVHGIAKSQTGLSDFHFHFLSHTF